MRFPIMPYVENIVIVVAISILFYKTKSPWVFLLLLLMNNTKTNNK